MDWSALLHVDTRMGTSRVCAVFGLPRAHRKQDLTESSPFIYPFDCIWKSEISCAKSRNYTRHASCSVTRGPRVLSLNCWNDLMWCKSGSFFTDYENYWMIAFRPYFIGFYWEKERDRTVCTNVLIKLIKYSFWEHYWIVFIVSQSLALCTTMCITVASTISVLKKGEKNFLFFLRLSDIFRINIQLKIRVWVWVFTGLELNP